MRVTSFNFFYRFSREILFSSLVSLVFFVFFFLLFFCLFFEIKNIHSDTHRLLIHIRPADFRKQDFFWPKRRLSMYLPYVISIDSVWRKYENYYPKVFLEKYNFIVLEKNVSNFDILHNLDSDDFD